MTTRERDLTPSSDLQTVGELRGLTGMRIVAATWVVLFHFHFTPLPGVAAVVAAVGPLLTAGALGVDLFFVLSGYVIAYTYLDRLGPGLRVRASARFLWARVCRLWPAYALVFHLFGLWLAARLWFGTDTEIAFQARQPLLSAGEYVEQLFMVQLWDDARFDGASWVGSTWSISAEWLAYLLFPVAAVGFYRLRGLPSPVLGLAAVAPMAPITWAYLSTGSPYYDWSWLVRLLCGFTAGVLAYLTVRRLCAGGAAPERVRRTASVLAAVLPVLIAAGLLAGEWLGPGRGGAVLVLFPVLVGALAVADRGPALLLSRPAVVFGGRISYCLYLVHIPLLELYWWALGAVPGLGPHGWPAHLAGLAVVAASFLLAGWLYRLVEEPAQARLRVLLPRRGAVGIARGHAPGPSFPAVAAAAEVGVGIRPAAAAVGALAPAVPLVPLVSVVPRDPSGRLPVPRPPEPTVAGLFDVPGEQRPVPAGPGDGLLAAMVQAEGRVAVSRPGPSRDT